MADTKITALTENTTPAATDIMPMVDDPGGSAATQKITLANLKVFCGMATDALWDTAGDLAVGTGANTAAKLALGTAYQIPRVKSDASTLEYVSAGRVLISEQTPTGTGTVTWDSIPATFKNLVIEFIGRSTKAATSELITIKFNNDGTASNYRRDNIQGYTGITNAANGTGDDNYIGLLAANNSAAGSAGQGIITVLNYAGTAFNKLAMSTVIARMDASSTHMDNELYAVEWENAAAITRVDLVLPSGNYNTGTTFRLYGQF